MTTDFTERGARTPDMHRAGGPPMRAARSGRRRRSGGRLRRRGLARQQLSRLRPRPLRRSRPAGRLPCAPPSRRPPRPWHLTRTGRRGGNSWPGCRAKSPSAASSTCCAAASDAARTISTCSTARRRRATRRRGNASGRTASPSPGSFATAGTKPQRALDIVLFVNGLPVFTFELKNNLTKQTVDDAVEQYRRDRNPREKLFELGRCVAHFAVDESEARFCTHLEGKASRFLPFNRGWNDGAGNPPNMSGIKTDYLWREVLTRESLTHILENYAHLVETKDPRTGRKRRTQIWPRYHQLDAVSRLLADAGAHGAGRRYLIQHSAGSGKSNSIAWLAHQLIGLSKDDRPVFDSIIVVTRPGDSRPADPRHDQAIRPGRRDRGLCRARGRPAPLHRVRQEDHCLDGAEVSPSSSTRSTTGSAESPSPSLSTRPIPARAAGPGAAMSQGTLRCRRGRRGRNRRRSDQPPDGIAQAAPPTPAISPSPPRRRTRRWRYSASPTRSPTARSGTAPSTVTP